MKCIVQKGTKPSQIVETWNVWINPSTMEVENCSIVNQHIFTKQPVWANFNRKIQNLWGDECSWIGALEHWLTRNLRWICEREGADGWSEELGAINGDGALRKNEQ